MVEGGEMELEGRGEGDFLYVWSAAIWEGVCPEY